MDIENDKLYLKIKETAEWFRCEASGHKKLNRGLWFSSSVISILVAIFANFKFTYYGITSESLTAILAIILPVITGYTVLRSPESLWIFEVDIRNRLNHLKEKIVFSADRDRDFNREPYEDEYFKIMGEANSRWQEIKKG